MRSLYGSTVVAAVALGSAAVNPFVNATARLIGEQGQEVGRIRLQESPARGVLMTVEISGLRPGAYQVVIHQRGRCEGPAFESAGAPMGETTSSGDGGSAPTRPLRFEVPGEGRVEVERLARNVTLDENAPNSLTDADGSALVIYAQGTGAEGAEGERGTPVACAVVLR
jgi:Cu-Zn family superoxide dismutase